MPDAPRIGISTCLLGRNVRYDGGHKRDDFLTDTFGRFVEWVPVCPEVEVGMGTPREAIRLVAAGDDVRLVGRTSGADWTERMRGWSAKRLDALAAANLSGYVLKKDSPSCGMERVKVHGDAMPRRNGRGLFAAALLERWPLLPVEEEGRLHDPKLRERFVEAVFAYRRLQDLFSGRWTLGDLVAFHTAHKLQLMAHSPAVYRELGRLVAGAAGLERERLRAEYERGFMTALKAFATTRRNVNVLQHMAGYFKRSLEPASRDELHAVIADYQAGVLPLVVPITLLRHHVRLHGVAYLAGQTYLQPHPKELMLRNHV